MTLEAYLEPNQITTMEIFLRKYLTALTTFAKKLHQDVRLGSKYASAFCSLLKGSFSLFLLLIDNLNRIPLFKNFPGLCSIPV